MDSAIRPASGTTIERALATNIAMRAALKASIARSALLMATHQKLLADFMSALTDRCSVEPSVTELTHQPSPELPDDFIIKALHEVWNLQTGDVPGPAVVPIGSHISRASKACSPEDSARLHVLRRNGRARSS